MRGMPSVEKYRGPTSLSHTRMPLVCSFSGPEVRTLLVWSLPVIEATSAAETVRTPGVAPSVSLKRRTSTAVRSGV